MAKLQTKWIADDAVNELKVKLGNDGFLRGRNNADSADVDIIKVNTLDALVLGAKLNDPTSAAPTSDTELANKKYVDDQVGSISIPSVFELQGNWDASGNSPALANTDTSVDGYLYYVNVAGSVDFGAGSITFSVGDWVYNVNGAWEKADNNDDVLSVAGKTGAVTLDTSNVSEDPSNLYFTEVRVEDTTLANFAVGTNTAVVNTDDVKTAFGKVQAQINAVLSATQTFEKDVYTLNGTDISNGFVTLSQTPVSNSVRVFAVGSPEQEESVDYTLSGTTLTFAGDLAAELAIGDKLVVSYAY